MSLIAGMMPGYQHSSLTEYDTTCHRADCVGDKVVPFGHSASLYGQLHDFHQATVHDSQAGSIKAGLPAVSKMHIQVLANR
ncbi:MAG: hypothetical protein PVJ25_07575, partial [Desulfuromonadales bacterium]